jgi:hypothetical protein
VLLDDDVAWCRVLEGQEAAVCGSGSGLGTACSAYMLCSTMPPQHMQDLDHMLTPCRPTGKVAGEGSPASCSWAPGATGAGLQQQGVQEQVGAVGAHLTALNVLP